MLSRNQSRLTLLLYFQDILTSGINLTIIPGLLIETEIITPGLQP